MHRFTGVAWVTMLVASFVSCGSLEASGTPSATRLSSTDFIPSIQPVPRTVTPSSDEEYSFDRSVGVTFLVTGEIPYANQRQMMRVMEDSLDVRSRNPDQAVRAGGMDIEVELHSSKEWAEDLLVAESKEVLRQAYEVETSPKGITVRAIHPEGLLYGIATAVQLVQVSDNHYHVPAVLIRDWPHYLERYVSEYHIPGWEFYDWLSTQKINGFATAYRALNWDGLSSEMLEGLERIGSYVQSHGTMRHLAQLHIGGRGGPRMRIGNPEELAQLLRTVDTLIDVGAATHIMICYDDVSPALTAAEQDLFESPAHAHVWLLNEVREHLDQRNEDIVLSFVPPYYRGFRHHTWRDHDRAELGHQYLAFLRNWDREDVPIVWTGPVTESRDIRADDVWRYREAIGMQHSLLYWDNSWHYYQPLRVFNSSHPQGFADTSPFRLVLLFVNGYSQAGRLFTRTAADFYWNPSDFDWVSSRRHAITMMANRDAAAASDRFYEFRGESTWARFARSGATADAYQTLLELSDLAPESSLIQDALTTWRKSF